MNPVCPIFSDLRQLLVPREFRIGRPAWPADLGRRLAQAVESAAAAAAQAQEQAARRPPEPPPGSDAGAALEERLKFLTDVATGLWRMRRAMVCLEGGRLLEARPREEMRKPFRWLVSVWDTLQESGLEIQDHTGERYLSGQSLKAHFEAAPELHEDTITDTIKPTIYFEGKIIQMGEVVVGTPDLAQGASPAPPQPAPGASPAAAKPPPEAKSSFAI